MGLFGKRAPAVDPDAHIGKTSAEILALPQLQIQFACIVLVHVLAYVAFSRKDSYFHSRPNIIAHYIPRGSGARALRARAPSFAARGRSTRARSRRFLLSFIWMASYGDYLWLFDEALADPGFDRIWGYHGGAEKIVSASARATARPLAATSISAGGRLRTEATIWPM